MKVVIQLILAVSCFFAFIHCEERIGNRVVKVIGSKTEKFHKALENCNKLNMNLLMVHNLEEERQAIALARKNNIWSIWLAATDIGHETQFYSVKTDEPVKYTNWAPGEPNNKFGIEHCAQLVANEALPNGWNDSTCYGNSLAYICEEIK